MADLDQVKEPLSESGVRLEYEYIVKTPGAEQFSELVDF